VGVDDGAFSIGRDHAGKAALVAVLLEGPRIVTLRLGMIHIDGVDGYRVLLSLLKGLTYNIVMLSGISFAGFNLIDIKKLARTLGKPVIAVVREKPNNRAVRDALRKHFDDWRQRWMVVKHAGPLYSCKPVPDEPRLYFEVMGATPDFAREMIKSSSFVSRLPEPVRVAGLLAKGLRLE
jgi:endonuclease V-like protein UPF0215 family